MTILIADDDDGYRYPLVNIFEDFGYKVAQAVDLNGLVEAAKTADIWIIDVRLPSEKNEGILAVTQLIASGIQPRYPVIFISVQIESFVRNELNDLTKRGISYRFIEKNFEPELLLGIVRDVTTKGN